MNEPSEKGFDEGAFHRRFKIVFWHKDGPSWQGFAEVACVEGSKTEIAFQDLTRAVRHMERGVPAEMRLGVLGCTITEPTSSEPEKPAFKLMRSSPVSPWYIEASKY